MMMDHYPAHMSVFEILRNDFRYTFAYSRKEERIITGCHFKGAGLEHGQS